MAEIDLTQLTGIYRSFQASDDIAINQLHGNISRNVSIDDISSISKNYLKKLFQILFPRESGSFKPSEDFWNELLQLASGDDQQQASKLLSRLIRVYYYGPNSEQFEKRISDWYLGEAGRPSAYYYPGIVQEGNRNVSGYIVANSLRETLPSDVLRNLKTNIMMVLIDTPGIDFKLRNADKVEVFANYIPAVAMSSAVPYVDVKFLDKRPASSRDPSLTFMSPLRFLLGAEPLRSQVISQNQEDQTKEANSSATALIYDASIYQLSKTPGGTAAGQSGLQQQTMIGMEMFTMPQTLVNMDYKQDLNPRYNPVINPTSPFATITGLSINITPQVGLISYKTAQLTLKVFDRSRLNEIADFLNPSLYSSANIVLTYGWRAPAQSSINDSSNEYYNFINDNLMKSEVYGIRNSSISIDNSGIASITLELFTKSVPELRDVTPNGASLTFVQHRNQTAKKLADIKQLAKDLKLTSLVDVAKDIRGSVLVGAALGGTFPELDNEQLQKDLNLLRQSLVQNSMGNARKKAQDFIAQLESLYGAQSAGNKNPKRKLKEQEDALADARKIIQDRFKPLRENRIDLFAHLPQLEKQSYDDPVVQQPDHPLSELRSKTVGNLSKSGINFDQYNKDLGALGELSFGKVFFTYFASACQAFNSEESFNEEFQVFFYNLNSSAGLVAGINIAEFPIDMQRLEDAYARRVVEQRGENMSLVNFLEIVRQSQFGDMRHPAFGFADFYVEKDGDYVLRETRTAKDGAKGSKKKNNAEKSENKKPAKGPAQAKKKNNSASTSAAGKPIEEEVDAQLSKRILTINKNGQPFVQPTIDFYVETGYETPPGANTHDLLLSFEKSVLFRSRNAARVGKKITRIHIYDKAAIPSAEAETILNSQNNGGYVKKISGFKRGQATINELNNTKKAIENLQTIQMQKLNPTAARDVISEVNSTLAQVGATTKFEYVSFKDDLGNPRFDLVKREVAKYVPTIIIGAESSNITNVSYSTNQDPALSTIFMMNNKSVSKDPMQPNGASIGDLPLRVIPGQLSLTMLGCPLVEYMQQFFVDLGTGTTVDNLYNVTGISHSISTGKFTTELKFSFADAYGQYESGESLVNFAKGFISDLDAKIQEQGRLQNRNRKTSTGGDKSDLDLLITANNPPSEE